MDQTKLMETGIYLWKRKVWVIAIALAIALIMVFCNCFFNSSYAQTYTVKISPDAVLTTFVSDEKAGSTVYLSNDNQYPFDDDVAKYVEDVKLSKRGNGRLNPYYGQKWLSIENVQNFLLEQGFSTYLQEQGFGGSASVTINTNNITINVSYGNKSDLPESNEKFVEYVESYLASVMQGYVKEVRDTHAKLLEQDEKQVQTLLSQYSDIVSKTNKNALSIEKCRSILSSYAQVAYNYDVSKAVVEVSDQLLEANVGHKVQLQGVSSSQSNSVKSVAVFGAFGLVVGLIFACFIVYIASFAKRILVSAKQQSQQKEIH